jgi:hypothetical protein
MLWNLTRTQKNGVDMTSLMIGNGLVHFVLARLGVTTVFSVSFPWPKGQFYVSTYRGMKLPSIGYRAQS